MKTKPKAPTYVLSLLVLACVSSTAFAQLPKLSNDELAKFRKKAALLVTDVQPAGELLLPINFFQMQFEKEVAIVDPAADPALPTPKLSLTQYDNKLVICTLIAEAMLETAKPDGLTDAAYLAAWTPKESQLLELKALDAPLVDARFKTVWQQFFKEWREAVIPKERFRDALRQAAYSLLRVALDIEKDHINRVVAGTAAPTGGSAGGTGASSTSGSGSGGYHHADVWHEHLMNGIYRRHNRNMNKIERIRARR